MAQRMHTADEGKVKNLLSAKQTHLQTSPTCHISILTMYTAIAEILKIKIRSTMKLAKRLTVTITRLSSNRQAVTGLFTPERECFLLVVKNLRSTSQTI